MIFCVLSTNNTIPRVNKACHHLKDITIRVFDSLISWIFCNFSLMQIREIYVLRILNGRVYVELICFCINDTSKCQSELPVNCVDINSKMNFQILCMSPLGQASGSQSLAFPGSTTLVFVEFASCTFTIMNPSFNITT